LAGGEKVDIALGLIGTIGALFSIVLLLVRLIAKKGLSYKVIGLVFLVSFIIFGIGVFMPSSSSNKTNSTSNINNQVQKDAANSSDKKIDETSKAKGDTTTSAAVSGQIKVHFINVGQADSILVQQGNSNMLIDAGNNEDANTIKGYLDSQGVKTLDAVIGTHAHEDHIGSMDYIINSFQVGKVYFPKQTSTTKTFQDFVSSVKNKGLQLTAPVVGSSFKIGDATVTIIAPNATSYEDANDYSIVVKVVYGNSSFLLTGDAESVSESQMVSKGLDLSGTVLKIGHHGSKSSTSQAFLDKVNPKYAVVSVGKDNSYGHPTQEVMNRLKAKNIPVYRTDESGTIVATSDGKEVVFNTKPGSYNGLIASSASSNGTSQTEQKPAPATTNNNSKIVYYTPSGKSYHYSNTCSTLSRSKTILNHTLAEALNSSHNDPCDVCVK